VADVHHLLRRITYLEVQNWKININYTINKFYYSINGYDQNNNPINEEKVINVRMANMI
jgi:hypothetical protein